MNTRIVVLTFLFVGAGFVFCVPADTEASSRGYRSGYRVEERIERRIAIITERLEARKARVEAQKNRILQRLASVEERLHAVTAQYACWLAHHTSCTSGTDEDGADTSTDDTANEEAEDEDDTSDTNTDTNTGDNSEDDTTGESDTGNTDGEASNDDADEENDTTEGDDNSAGDTSTDGDTTEDEQSQDNEEDTDGQENDIPNIGVRVNEIAWMGTAEGGTKEWIELYNSGSAVDLTGWTLVADDGAPSITLAGTISANGYFLLERTSDATVPNVLADQIYTGDLSNGGEVLRLRDSAGVIVDTVDGSDNWAIGGNNTTKETLQRMGDGWGTATGTPRALNASI